MGLYHHLRPIRGGRRDVTWRVRILCVALVSVLGRGFGLAPAVAAEAGSAAACKAWRVVPSPTVVGAVLVAVSGSSSNDVWAVGSLFSQTGGLIEHWDGVSWTLVSQPRALLRGVVAITPSDAWAVQGFGVAEHWDGTVWTQVNVPSPGTGSTLFRVSAASSNDVWAGGYYVATDGKLHPLAIHYDGTSWTMIDAPDGSPFGTNVFQSLSVVGPDDVWGVGYQDITGGFDLQPLIEHWDGTSWTVVPGAGPLPGTDNSLYAVAGAASDDVWAVGIYGANIATPLIEHWNGTAWTQTTLSGLANSNELFDVAARSSTDVWAVGKSFKTGPAKPFTEHWSGATWKNEPSPNPGNANLYGVAVTGANKAWAVGDDFDEGLNEFVPFIEQSRGPC